MRAIPVMPALCKTCSSTLIASGEMKLYEGCKKELPLCVKLFNHKGPIIIYEGGEGVAPKRKGLGKQTFE
jgi:hypothetical protein